ncbi:hypothetical protein K443DRAFT_25230, partial [Laccaria amethystina LaAM-08-1]
SRNQTKEKANGRRRGGIQVTNTGRSMFGEITDIVALYFVHEFMTMLQPRFGSKEINPVKTRVHVTSGPNVPCHLISTCTGYFQYHQLVLPPEDLSKMDLLHEKRLPSLRNGTPIRSNLAFGFFCGEIHLLAEIELNKLYLTEITSGTTSRVYET